MLGSLKSFFYEKVILRRDFERMYMVFGGHILFQTLRTAVQLGLFDLIQNSGPLTRQEIAQKLRLEEQPVRIIILGLTSVGFLKRDRGGRYSLSRLTKELFLKASLNRITAYVELQHRVMYKGLCWLMDSVVQNKNVGLKEFKGHESTLYERLAHDQELEGLFQQAMQELSVHANSQLATNLDLKDVRFLVDVGGGNGTNIIALARKWPHLRAAVFDSPTVCEIARSNIQAHGLSQRVSVLPGNCFENQLPEGADAFMFCHFFTIWGEKGDRELLKKCFQALPEGGRVIIFNMMQNNDETGPLTAALGSPYFLSIATGKGMLYTWDEYKKWILETGFRKVDSHRLRKDHGIIVAVK